MTEQQKMKTKVEELQKLCEPLIEYIKKNYHPYTEIAVSMDFIKIRSENLSIPIEAEQQN